MCAAQEMEILGRVHHPHIVLLIGACLEGVPALVYELAEGEPLYCTLDEVALCFPRDLRCAVLLALDLCSAPPEQGEQ